MTRRGRKPKPTPKRNRRAGKRKTPPPRRRFRLAALAKWVLVAAIWGGVGLAGMVAWYAWDLPAVESLTATRKPSIAIVDRRGAAIVTYGERHAGAVALAALPPHLIQAVTAVEDRRFFDHFGLDLYGLARAMAVNITSGRIVEGGSTISQQLAKNLFLSPERSLSRKIRETLLALWLEHRFTKEQILTIYLNRVYFGAGAFGVEAAARTYFDRPATALTLYQSALLAGLLKAPSRYAPTRNPERAAGRARVVLASMVAAGFLTAAEAKAARAAPAKLRAAGPSGVGPPGAKANVRHFADWVLDRVSSFVGGAARDIVVVTTLDRRLQRLAAAEFESALDRLTPKRGAGPQGAMIVLAPDGAIRAMLGGRDYRESQFNRATQALRQPGSAFKLFVYLAALERGVAPNDRVRDAPITVDGWTPRNFAGRYRGAITVRDAFANSVNTAAVRIGERAGRHRVIAAARRLGVTSELRPHPSLALGAGEVTLLELGGAYAAFANGGAAAWPYAIAEIRDSAGKILYRRDVSDGPRVVAKAQVAQMHEMLSGVLRHGTGRAAALARPAAGKTGTSQKFRDAWFVGYTADLVAGVWMGHDDGRPMKGVTGGGAPARLWRRFMTAAHKGMPARALPATGPMPESDADEPDENIIGWVRPDAYSIYADTVLESARR